ncbi:tripartite tricarboxylate transporter permease [Paenibacillus xerothermodurans]|uniref:Tripartite tricarboxylate transporter permease n=2 Tax=Paenibacillus xerothermodurans TaxID=1977292 RepID=A0A2W1NSX3_PAEXE|nr:tripartite tricarboxylate transporter permease [Paenibacillus xerothermodurans]
MCALGVLIGTFVGVLPGLGPTSAIAILLPATTVLDPAQGIIMLAGIYYGAMYGGSTTAILLNIPGEVSSVPTCLDGYALTKRGRGGPALGIAAVASFAAGTLGVVGLALFAPFLADQALKFGPPEYFALMFLAFTVIVNLAGNSVAKALAMGAFGFLLASVGIGNQSGMARFHYGSTALTGGLDMISIIIGLFAITEVFKGLSEKRARISNASLGSVYPTRQELIQCLPTFLRGGAVGFVLGLLPGCSAAISSFFAYDLEKKMSKQPERFGKGALEGVAGPEAANNATSSAGFIPLLALGIPSSPPLAILLAGLMIYGLTPGPVLFEQNAAFVWTIIASMFIGNAMLLILNLPMVGVWARLTQVPYGIMAPVILLLSSIGAYTVRNSLLDVFVAYLFGGAGYLFYKYHWPALPLVLGFILGPLLERSFLQSLSLSGESFSVFFTRPISAGLLAASLLLLFVSMRLKRKTKEKMLQQVGEELEIA